MRKASTGGTERSKPCRAYCGSAAGPHDCDPSARHIDWQGCFGGQQRQLGFATFVHCLLDGGAGNMAISKR